MSPAAILPELPHSANQDPLAVAHPAHRGFLERIDADPVIVDTPNLGQLSNTVLRDILAGLRAKIAETHDVYLVVGATALYSVPKYHSVDSDGTFILLAADFRFNGMGSYDVSFPKDGIKYIDRVVDTTLLERVISRYIDGVVAVSELMKATIERFVSIPTGIAHPYIDEDVYERFSRESPTLDSRTAVTVSEARDHKGVDLLVDAWPRVRSAYPDASLHVVGSDHPRRYGSVPGVTVHGYVDSLADVLSKCSLYVHPARFDAFPVTVLEAMRMGLPPLVTTGTGSKSVVSEVDQDLVVAPTREAIARGVVSYFDRDVDSRTALSDEMQAESTAFQRSRCLRRFEEEFHRVLESVPGVL